MRALTRLASTALALVLGGALVVLPQAPALAADQTRTPVSHFVYLMQGDRTFDNYFGTYPGAAGLPADACQPLVIERPQGCVKPFPLHDKQPGSLDAGKTVVDDQFNAGRMNGFVAAYQKQGRDGTTAMGYYDDKDVPYYWNLADRYVLFDKFFSAAPFGIRLNRSYWVSGAPPPGNTDKVPAGGYGDQATIFDRLEAAGVSWKFYVQDFDAAETFRAVSPTDPAPQTARVPLLNYTRFVDNPKLRGHIVDLDEYYQDLDNGTLPAVAYVASSGASERSARSIPAGQQLVRSMVTQLQLSRYWSQSAFMWSYDGSGGWFDHVKPPTVDGRQLGLRVPALLVSPYAPAGRVDHTQLDYTGALRFVQDNWNLQPLNDRSAKAPSIAAAFDFTKPPRAAVVLGTDRVAPQTTKVDVGVIYTFYGGGLLLGVALVALALVWPRLGFVGRRRPRVRAVVAKEAAPHEVG